MLFISCKLHNSVLIHDEKSLLFKSLRTDRCQFKYFKNTKPFHQVQGFACVVCIYCLPCEARGEKDKQETVLSPYPRVVEISKELTQQAFPR